MHFVLWRSVAETITFKIIKTTKQRLLGLALILISFAVIALA
jgi:hypothetical protein